MASDRSADIRQTLALALLSTGLALAATAAARALRRRRSAAEGWARSTDEVPERPRPTSRPA